MLGRVVGAVLGKKEGENVVDITTTVDMLPVFWEAEKASFITRSVMASSILRHIVIDLFICTCIRVCISSTHDSTLEPLPGSVQRVQHQRWMQHHP